MNMMKCFTDLCTPLTWKFGLCAMIVYCSSYAQTNFNLKSIYLSKLKLKLMTLEITLTETFSATLTNTHYNLYLYSGLLNA